MGDDDALRSGGGHRNSPPLLEPCAPPEEKELPTLSPDAGTPRYLMTNARDSRAMCALNPPARPRSAAITTMSCTSDLPVPIKQFMG